MSKHRNLLLYGAIGALALAALWLWRKRSESQEGEGESPESGMIGVFPPSPVEGAGAGAIAGFEGRLREEMAAREASAGAGGTGGGERVEGTPIAKPEPAPAQPAPPVNERQETAGEAREGLEKAGVIPPATYSNGEPKRPLPGGPTGGVMTPGLASEHFTETAESRARKEAEARMPPGEREALARRAYEEALAHARAGASKT